MRDSARDSVRTRPVIWRAPVGLGQLYVSGAFDAWRFRDTSMSTFDATWRDLVDEAAAAHQPPLELQVTPRLLTPRAAISIVARPRDSLNTAPLSLLMRAVDAADGAAVPNAIAAAARGGAYEAVVRAPLDTGTYEVLAIQGADTARVPVVVAPVVSLGADDDPDLLSAWTASRGGRVIPRDSLASLTGILDDALRPVPRMVEWHPMRSPWWILPFALALSAEWWQRRRRGLT